MKPPYKFKPIKLHWWNIPTTEIIIWLFIICHLFFIKPSPNIIKIEIACFFISAVIGISITKHPFKKIFFTNIDSIDLAMIGAMLFLLTLFSSITSLPFRAFWIVVGIYRHLHELLWHFHYWITINVLNKEFADRGEGIATHGHMVLIVILTILFFSIAP